MGNGLTRYERLEIQMEALVPMIRGLQQQLGSEIVLDALRRRLDERIGAAQDSCATKGRRADMTRVVPGMETWATGGALEYDIVHNDEERVDLDVTTCRYTALMDRLSARDLGEILVCGEDHVAAAAVGMELDRAHTHMKGDNLCDFRFTPVELTRKAQP